MIKTTKSLGGKIVKDIKRATYNQYSAEEKIRIVLLWAGKLHRHHRAGQCLASCVWATGLDFLKWCLASVDAD